MASSKEKRDPPIGMMDIQQSVLPNGITVVTAPMEHLRSVTVVYSFHVGSRYEALEDAGICHFIEHMLFKGTEQFPTARLLSEAVENVGGDLNASTGKESTEYSVKVRSDQVERAFQVLTQMVRAPLFAPVEVEKERRVITEELSMYKDSPQEWVQVLLDELIFPNVPLGREVVGTEESLTRITAERIRAFFAQHYVPASLVVSAAGRTTHATITELTERYLGDWHGGPVPTWEPFQSTVHKQYVSVLSRKNEQVNLCLAVPSIGYEDPEFDALTVMSAILGEGMSSRLFQSVREDRGLVYDIGSSTASFHETGIFEITAGCDPRQVDAVIQATLTELRRLRTEPPTSEELQRIKDYVSGRLAIGLEDTGSVAGWLGSQLVLRGHLRTIDEIIERILAVTRDDVQRVALRLLRAESLHLAAIGPLPRAGHFSALLTL